jgi:multimeric flavodoxin WrbA
MRVIVINAAPRMETGNTQILLNPFLVGMRHAGAQVDIALLGRKTIKTCIGCFTCYAKAPGVCIHADDMSALIDRIRPADMMVLATPIYLDGMTGLAKVFIDRLVAFLDPHFVLERGTVRHPLRWKFPEKTFVVSVCGYPGVENFEPLLLHMERLAKNLHSTLCGALLRPAAFSLLMTKKYPDAVRSVLDAARAAGEELVKTGVVSPSTLDAVSGDICTTGELVRLANAYWDRELGDSPDRLA